MIIHPEVIVAPDRPIVRFREPREAIKLDEELPKILHRQGWSLGTFFDIQFLNYEKTKLLSLATFVVTEWHENLLTSEADPYKPMTRTVFSSKAEQIGEWWELLEVEPAVEFPDVGKEQREKLGMKSPKKAKTAAG